MTPRKVTPYSVNITLDVQCTCIYAVGMQILVKSNFYNMITIIAEKKTNDLKSHIKISLKVELKPI